MKKVLTILSIMLLLAASCSNRKTPTGSNLIEYSSHNTASERTKSDTIYNPTPKLETTKVHSSTSSNMHSNQQSDNMRGFDPASEDDMDDNGMSRYMENDDEEGWD